MYAIESTGSDNLGMRFDMKVCPCLYGGEMAFAHVDMPKDLADQCMLLFEKNDWKIELGATVMYYGRKNPR